MTIGKRIGAVSAVLMILTAILGVVSLVSNSRIAGAVYAVSNQSLPAARLIGRIDSVILDLRGATLHHVATPDPKMKAVKDTQTADQEKQALGYIAEYQKLITSDRDRQLFAPIPAAAERYFRACAQVRALSRRNLTRQAMAIYDTEGDAARKILKTAIAEELEFNRVTAAANSASADSTSSRATWWSVTLLVCVLLVGIALATVSIRSINHILGESISQLHESSEQVAGASGIVARASQNLAGGASQQAASLEETSASAAEITAMTRQNATHSQSASHMMAETDRSIRDANETLRRMMTSMLDITSSSEKISKIIKVIDEIAFQTNILALNAAVEAARAGESGLGFAVVADEVRTLAQRSAQAARDTTQLIEESIGKAAEGKTTLDQVAVAISRITEGATQVKTLVDEVSTGSQQQATGIEQVSQSIALMESTTQQTAATAEESASASQELNAQALTMRTIVDQLRGLVAQ